VYFGARFFIFIKIFGNIPERETVQ